MAESTNWFSVKVFIDTADVLALAGIEPEPDGLTSCVVRNDQVEVTHVAPNEPVIVTPGGGTDISAAWPIGSIYLSAVATDPATLLGFGTWTAIAAGRLLLGTDGTHALGTTGGSDTPAGSVSQPAFTGSALAGHTHAFTGDAVSSTAVSAGTPAGSVAAPTFTGSASQATSAVSAGTPAGTNNAPIFTGSALATHAHELPFTKLAGGTAALRMLAQSVFGSGTSRAPESVSAAPTANTTAATVALSQAVSAGTPAGTVAAPVFTGSALGTHSHTLTPAGTNSAPAFTGNALGTHQHSTTATGTNASVSAGTPAGSVSQPSFTGTPGLPPYLAINVWQRTA